MSCCWQKEYIGRDECSFLRDSEEELLFNRKKRFLRRCLECPRFLEDLQEVGRKSNGLGDLFPYLFEELLALRVQVQTLNSVVESRNREIKFLHEVSLVLQTSVDMDEVISMTLTAVTAGKGFGLNRAILLLVDKSRQNLKGYFAVGPRHGEDAARIWREIEEKDYTLREMGQLFFEKKMPAEREKFRDLLDILSVPLNRQEHLFVKTLSDQISRHIQDLFQEPDIDPEQVHALGVREMILVPLISKNRRIGLLLADNIVNGRPIATEDLHSLETFALPVSFAIERAALYERLQEELAKLTEANRRLKEQQDTIVRMEKMALVGKITANLAHSIRNPLTIIGGFARTLIKQTPTGDAKRQYLESMMREARRLEEVLQEVLAYSESLHPTRDLWDINQLIAGLYAGMRDDLEIGDIECRLDFAADLPLVMVDYKTISSCLRSILNNAMEAMPNGGTLRIGTVRADNEVLITVSDTGPGMSAKTVKQATAPFFSTKDRGSGLGLSLCARILEGHGAEFDILSSEGAGTTFTIRLQIPREELNA
jgi:signal transduction histidine kinase